jgi:hypothetical protein
MEHGLIETNPVDLLRRIRAYDSYGAAQEELPIVKMMHVLGLVKHDINRAVGYFKVTQLGREHLMKLDGER